MKRTFLQRAPIVRLQGQAVLLFNDPLLTLLDALEIKKVRIFSECRGGYCGSCKTKIKSGSVSYHLEPLIPLASNECLPCCCRPSTDLDLDLSANGADVIPTALNKNQSTVFIGKTEAETNAETSATFEPV